MDFLCEFEKRMKNGRVTVIGIGVSNLPLIYKLVEKGAKVSARDKKSYAELPVAPELEKMGVKLILGDAYLDNIDEDIIFRSPGIRPDVKGIKEATDRGALLTSEMELFFELTPAMTFAVTGSDGKTTTTTLAYKMLDAEMNKKGAGNVYVGGNIGAPLLPLVDKMTKDDFAVLELSSFQLQTMHRSPMRAVITNVTPNHLNWHTGMDEYVDAKRNICRYEPIGHLTVNAENEITAGIGAESNIPVTFFSSKHSDFDEITGGKQGAAAIFEKDGYITYSDGKTEKKIIRTDDILLPGRHNVENYMAAISLTWGYVGFDTIDDIAKNFGGVEHRLELVRTFDGVKYYNSSIDSSPTRTAAALSALREKPITICGGYDKNIPFAPLAKALCDRAKAVILTGATAEKIEKALSECPDFDPGKLTVKIEKDFDRAVFLAKSMAKSGDTVLLSPACASFDAFPNFAERGKHFKELVNSFGK